MVDLALEPFCRALDGFGVALSAFCSAALLIAALGARGRGRSKTERTQGRDGGAEQTERSGVCGAPKSLPCVRAVLRRPAPRVRGPLLAAECYQNAERGTGQTHKGPYKTAERVKSDTRERRRGLALCFELGPEPILEHQGPI